MDELEVIDASLAAKITDGLRASRITPKRRYVMDRIRESLASGLGAVKITNRIYPDMGPQGPVSLDETDYSYFESLGYTVTRPVESALADAPSTDTDDDDSPELLFAVGTSPSSLRTKAEIRWRPDEELEVVTGSEVL